jgi:hypothetical protein
LLKERSSIAVCFFLASALEFCLQLLPPSIMKGAELSLDPCVEGDNVGAKVDKRRWIVEILLKRQSLGAKGRVTLDERSPNRLEKSERPRQERFASGKCAQDADEILLEIIGFCGGNLEKIDLGRYEHEVSEVKARPESGNSVRTPEKTQAIVIEN